MSAGGCVLFFIRIIVLCSAFSRLGACTYLVGPACRISDITRVEVDRRIDIKEYVSLLAEADPERRPIRKTRYCLTENSRYYEIDIYPEWHRQAILEIELNDENEDIVLPADIKVIKEVTDDPVYSNFEMAKHMPEE